MQDGTSGKPQRNAPRGVIGTIQRGALRAALLLPLMATPCAAYDVLLRWTTPRGTLTGYRIYRGSAPRSYGLPEDVGLLAAATVDGVVHAYYPNLALNTAHYFAVTAYNAAGESDYSNEKILAFASVSPPTADAGADRTVTANVTVSIGGPAQAGVGYFWEQTAGPAAALSTRTGTPTQFTPTVAGTYTFTLTAYDGMGVASRDTVTVTVSAPRGGPATATRTFTATHTATRSPTATPTPPRSPKRTATRSPTRTFTATRTRTPTGFDHTPTPSSTPSPAPSHTPTKTRTRTPTAPQATASTPPAGSTSTPSPSSTAPPAVATTSVPTPTVTATPSPAPSHTLTKTRTPTAPQATPTPAVTATPSLIGPSDPPTSRSSTPTKTSTLAPSQTPTLSPTRPSPTNLLPSTTPTHDTAGTATPPSPTTAAPSATPTTTHTSTPITPSATPSGTATSTPSINLHPSTTPTRDTALTVTPTFATPALTTPPATATASNSATAKPSPTTAAPSAIPTTTSTSTPITPSATPSGTATSTPSPAGADSRKKHDPLILIGGSGGSDQVVIRYLMPPRRSRAQTIRLSGRSETCSGPLAAALGDVDGDGTSDLVLGPISREGKKVCDELRVYRISHKGAPVLLDRVSAFAGSSRSGCGNLAIGDVEPTEPGAEIVVAYNGARRLASVIRIFGGLASGRLRLLHEIRFHASRLGSREPLRLAIGDVLAEPERPGPEIVFADGQGGIQVFGILNGNMVRLRRTMGFPDLIAYAGTLRVGDLAIDHPGDEVLITATAQGIGSVVRVLDADSGAVLMQLAGAEAGIEAIGDALLGDVVPRVPGAELLFNADGRLHVFTLAAGKPARLFDPVAPLAGPAHPFTQVAVGDFLPNLPGSEIAATPALAGPTVTVLRLSEHGASQAMHVSASPITEHIESVVAP